MIHPAKRTSAPAAASTAPSPVVGGWAAAPPRWWLLRATGFAGSVLLAVAGWLGGALRAVPFHPTPVSIWRGPHGPAVLLCWLVGTAALVWAWWRARHGVPSLRWCLVTVGLWLAPLLVAPPLGSRDVYAYACQGAVYHAGHNPYTEGVAALPCPWLDSVSPIWRETGAPYGPLFLMIAGLAVALGGTLAGTIVVLRLVAVLGVGLAAVGLPVLARHAGIDLARSAWLALACPLVAVHLVSGAHNDALMIGLLVLGLAVVATVGRPGGVGPADPGPADPELADPELGGGGLGGRRWRPLPGAGVLLVGGVLLGLAVAVKASAAVAVPFAALLAVRGGYSTRRLVRDGGWVVGGALIGLLTATAVAGLGFGWVRALSGGAASVQWTSPPTALGLTIGLFSGTDAVPATRLIGLVALAAVLVVLWWRSRTRDALYATGLALAFAVVLAPVFHPWYATWPLFVLAVSSRRSWYAVPCLVACFLDLPDGTSLALSTRAVGAVAMTLFVAYLLVVAVHRGRRSGPPGAPGEPAGPPPG